MKKCFSCGFDNEDDSKFCATCGAALAPSDPVEPAKSDPFVEQIMPTVSASEGGQQPTTVEQKGGFKAKFNSAKNKTVEFEKKHSVILNAIVAVCALVIALVALFAPIKTVQYVSVVGYNMEVEDLDEGDKSVTYCYTEVNQSIWQMIGSIGYIKANDEDKIKFAEQLSGIKKNIGMEVAAWALAHPDADEVEQMSAMADIVADNLSDLNYLGYIMAMKGSSGVDGEDGGISISGDYWAAVLSMAFGLAITVIAMIIAVFSLVHIILAIIGMAKKKPQQKLYKYLGLMIALSGAGLACMFAAPMLKAGGGMFAVALFSAIAYLICGGVGALLAGKDRKIIIIKRAIIATVAIIAFFMLTTNVFSITVLDSDGASESMNVPTGYGIYGMLATLDLMDAMGENAAASLLLRVASGYIGVVFYILMAGFAISYALTAMKRSLKRLAFGEVSKSKSTPFMIASAVFMLISIIVGLALSEMVIEKLAAVFGDNTEFDRSMEWTVRAQVWVSMIMLIIAAVFDLAFKPAGKQPAPAEAQQPVA